MSRVFGIAVVCALCVPGFATAQEHVQAPRTQPHAQAPEGTIVMRAKVEAGQVFESKVRIPFESKVVTGAPYSADVVTETTQTLADGNRIVHRTTGRVYRDAQGRVRREDGGEGGRPMAITIMDPVARVSYSIDTESRVAWKTPFEQGSGVFTFAAGSVVQSTRPHADPVELGKREQIERELAVLQSHREQGAMVVRIAPTEKLTHLSEWEEKTETLSPRQIEGVTVEGTRTTRTIPAGAIGNERPIEIVSEQWRSPDLQVLVATTQSDPRSGETVYKLQNVNRVEPDRSLFDVPGGYAVKDTKVPSVPSKREHDQ